MPYRQIALNPGHYYHVYNRGHNRELIFFERENYLYFLRQLRKYLIERQAADIIAYCLMPNHYHLLLYVKVDYLSRVMQQLGLSYAKAINQRHRRVGSLFQGRFQAIAVDSDEYLYQLTRYIHLNPVKAKIVNRPEDWEFSSYPEYLGLRRGSLPKFDAIQGHFKSAADYRLFVESSIQTTTIQHLMFDE
ncbi:transposase [Spirulina subsalsa FACHB-351]|uniref:Transposase n=1 Tax=Spirulina subsalsa FACHB-351 TaxID=234711 RepID=A0ABT3L556_9CYAN|nr:transposase [Spirulina subsalsa]MCW6036628.1 transposase [Spirulina subsalsa FACHB-351]